MKVKVTLEGQAIMWPLVSVNINRNFGFINITKCLLSKQDVI